MRTSTRTRKQEREVKIQPRSNLQFKYTSIATPQEFATRANSLLRIIGLRVGPTVQQALIDSYYDFDDFALGKGGYSLRVRKGEIEPSNCKITLKHRNAPLLFRGIERDEVEIVVAAKPGRNAKNLKRDWRSLINNPRDLFKALRIRLPFSVEGRLVHLGSVHNDRTAVDFSTDIGKWRLSYDRFYFFRGDKDASSEFTRYFSEIEVELLSGRPSAFQRDEKFIKVVEALTTLFGMATSQATKLDRAMACKWGSEAEVAYVYVVGFDITSYSKRPPPVQLQLIQRLNKWVKESLASARQSKGVSSADNFTVYIPTGDGMFLVFDNEDDASLIPEILGRLGGRVENYNRAVSGGDVDKSIRYRIGVHAGPVFKYSDINEELNFAGNGLNIAARVLDRAAPDQILMSAAAKEFLDTGATRKASLLRLGVFRAKHEVAIEGWNYYDRRNNVGIPHRLATTVAKAWR